MPPQLNWACEICGRPFGRRYSAERHVKLRHNGRGLVIDYPSYLVRVLAGRSSPPETIHPWSRENRRSVNSLDLDSVWDGVWKELDRRMVQRLADELDPMKASQSSAEIANKLLLQRQYAPKVVLVGYRASVCRDCLKGYIQSIFSWGSLATGFRSTSLPEHECLAKDLETAKHIDKTVEMQIVWKNLEERLITIVSKWGKSEKLAVSIPRNSKEEKCIDLGVVEEGHWTQRAAKGATVLKEPELQDFLRRAHATEGIFRLTLRGESRIVRITLVSEDEKSNSKVGLSQGEKKVIGYRGYGCQRCFTAEALEIYLSGKELSERKHQCDPTIFRTDIFNADGTLRHLSDELPSILFESVKAWAKDRKYLQAVKVEGNEKYIELCSPSENHWANRAIKGRTILDDEELLDFLKKAEATFGFFKIKNRKVEHFYYMMISDVPF